MPRSTKQMGTYGQPNPAKASILSNVGDTRVPTSNVNVIEGHGVATAPKKRGRPGRPRLSESNKKAAKLALEGKKESELVTRKSPRTLHVSQTDLQSALRSVRKTKKGSDSDDVCAKCMDDPSVKSCTACGCRVCTPIPKPTLFICYFNVQKQCLFRYTSEFKAQPLHPCLLSSTDN